MSAVRLPLIFSLVLALTVALGAAAFIAGSVEQPEGSPADEQTVFPTSLTELPNTAAAPELDILTWRTEADTQVLFLPTHQLPMVEARFTFNAGGARDGEQAGIASLTNAMLDQGTSKYNVDDIAENIENLGAQLELGSYRDMAVVSLTSLSEPELLAQATTLFTHLLAAPSFPQNSIERLRTRTVQRLKMQLQTPGPQLSRAFQAELFAHHPYGQPTLGTEESLAAITRSHLQAFHQRYYTAANATLAIVGDLTEQQARQLSERLSQALPQGVAAPELPMATVQPSKNLHLPFDSSQTHITLGNQMIHRGHADYVPLYVGNHILGGSGFSAILMNQVRQQRGLVYGIYSSVSPMAAAGPFTLQLQTANENKDKALTLTLSLLQDFVAQGPTADQLELAISDLTGGFALSTASNSALVGQLSAIGFYDLPLDYLADFHQALGKVTAEDIKAAFARHLDPDNLVIVSIGPEAPQRVVEDE